MTPLNSILHGDCIEIMQALPSHSVDFILTDPPYLVRYRSRDGQRVRNDDNDAWLRPAFAEMYRLLKPGAFCFSFYGWNTVDRFFAAWKEAGFRPVGHVVFRKRYASRTGFYEYRHEQAYLLGKGTLPAPDRLLPDVQDWDYTGNRLHPTQKPVPILKRQIEAFCPDGGVVLDPFCGSGSTCVAAAELGLPFIGIELDASHVHTARRRIAA
jgi:DNA modification methylase